MNNRKNKSHRFGSHRFGYHKRNPVSALWTIIIIGVAMFVVLSGLYSEARAAAWFGSAQNISPVPDGAFDVYSADLDGDGDEDVLSASVNDNTIA